MENNHYNMLSGSTFAGIMKLLGGDEQVLALLSADGYVQWQTPAAERVLRVEWKEPVMAVLSEEAAEAVSAAARTGGCIDLEEDIDDVLYRLRSYPVEGGLLLHAEPCGGQRILQKIDFVRTMLESETLMNMTSTVRNGLEHAQDEEDRALWAHMKKLTLRARLIRLHEDMINGEQCLDERVAALDLAALCRETAAAAAERLGIAVEVTAEEVRGVLSSEVFRFVLLDLLVYAAAKKPACIPVSLRRAGGRIFLQVTDCAAELSTAQLGAMLSGWRGSAAGSDPRELAQLNLGLPAVQQLLSRTGGSLFAEADGGVTRLIAVFPGDYAEDPPELRQTEFSSGIGDLTEFVLSVL